MGGWWAMRFHGLWWSILGPLVAGRRHACSVIASPLRSDCTAPRLGVPLGILTVLLIPGPPTALAEELTSSVSYLTSSMIYVDAGTDQGLAKGSLLEFRRDGVTLARIPVMSLSSKRSACAAPQEHDIRVGDQVVFQAVPSPRAADVAPPRDPSPLHFPERNESPRDRIPGTWRGRAGLRFMARTDAMEFGTDTYQPALDLRADAVDFLRPELSVKLDVRTRRTFTSSSPASRRSNGRTRVHHAAAQWRRADSPWSVRAGRQFVSAVASVGVLDGVALEYEGARWSTGVLTGTLPDPTNYGFSTAIRQHGAYVARYSGPGAVARWRLALALLGAYENGRINREHVALQGRWHRGRVFATALQEVDLNRDWRAAEQSGLSLTSTFWSVRLAATEHLTLNSGFDARRNVLLYRDTVTPETEFDDSYRRGYWSGIAYRPVANLRLDLSGRRSTSLSAGSASSATGRVRVSTRRLLGASLASRHTVYDNEHALGMLHSVTAGVAVTSRGHLETTWGIRRERGLETTSAAGETSNDADWWSIEGEAYLSRGWYVLADVEHTAGDREDNTLFFLSAIHRFQ